MIELLLSQELNVLRLLAIVVGLWISYTVFYAFLFSPVRHIPGPWWARLSKLPLLRATYERRRSKYASDLLAQYGPVVVIAPDQVHTNDAVAMQAIYSRKSLKTPFYAGMGSWKGVTSTLGFVTYKDAAPTRNNLIQIFQNRNLATLVENISSHIMEFCQVLDEKMKMGEDVDGVILFRLLALDIVTDVLWGEKKTLLSKGSDGATNQETSAFLKRFHAFSTYNAMKSFIPGFDLYTRYLGTEKWRALRQDCSDMDVTAKEALERWKSDSEHRDRDVLSMMISMDQAVDERKRIPKEHIPAYMVEMLAAGSSTTSHTATFTCFELANHPEIQSKLHRELVDKFPDEANIDQKEMMDLPYLDAVLRETMRLMPMIPGPLERYLAEPVDANGLQIPAGVIASTAAYDQGRLPAVYPEPGKWQPDRWLGATDDMHLNWTPFGHGARGCPGSNLAMTELKYMIGTIIRLYRVEPPKQHKPKALDLGDIFVSGERSGSCWLHFADAR